MPQIISQYGLLPNLNDLCLLGTAIAFQWGRKERLLSLFLPWIGCQKIASGAEADCVMTKHLAYFLVVLIKPTYLKY